MELGQVWNRAWEHCREVKVQGVCGSDVVIESLQHIWSAHEVVVDIS